jgi:hypothetical protein
MTTMTSLQQFWAGRRINEQAARKEARHLASEIAWGEPVPGRPTILALDRGQFAKDIAAMRVRSTLTFATISAVRLRHVQEKWVPLQAREQTFFTRMVRRDYRHLLPVLVSFGLAFLDAAAMRRPIAAVLSANVDYWQDEAMKIACSLLGIPFLVLCRENRTIPWTTPWLQERFAAAQFRFEGAGIACFSDATKIALQPCMRDADDIWVTGAPRYDDWQDVATVARGQRDCMTLVSFNQPGYAAASTFLEVFDIFAEAARQGSATGLDWHVKCKKRADVNEIRRARPDAAVDRLRFSHDRPLFELFPRSRLVIGYNSLAILEALFTDVPIVVPWWDQTRPSRDALLLDPEDPMVAAVIHVADSPAQLRRLIGQAAAGRDLTRGTAAQRRALFCRHLHLPESGHASASVEAFIRHYID